MPHNAIDQISLLTIQARLLDPERPDPLEQVLGPADLVRIKGRRTAERFREGLFEIFSGSPWRPPRATLTQTLEVLKAYAGDHDAARRFQEWAQWSQSPRRLLIMLDLDGTVPQGLQQRLHRVTDRADLFTVEVAHTSGDALARIGRRIMVPGQVIWVLVRGRPDIRGGRLCLVGDGKKKDVAVCVIGDLLSAMQVLPATHRVLFVDVPAVENGQMMNRRLADWHALTPRVDVVWGRRTAEVLERRIAASARAGALGVVTLASLEGTPYHLTVHAQDRDRVLFEPGRTDECPELDTLARNAHTRCTAALRAAPRYSQELWIAD